MSTKFVSSNFANKSQEIIKRAHQRREEGNVRIRLSDGSVHRMHSFVAEFHSSKLAERLAASDGTNDEMHLENFHAEEVEKLLEFCYLGTVIIPNAKLISMAELSSCLGIDELCKSCVRAKAKLPVNANEYCQLMHLLGDHHFPAEFQLLFDRHEAHFSQFMQSFSPDKVGGQMMKNLLSVESTVDEDVLASTLLAWLHCAAARELADEEKTKFLQLLRPELMSQKALKAIMCDNDCRKLINSTFSAFLDAYRIAGRASMARKADPTKLHLDKKKEKAHMWLMPYAHKSRLFDVDEEVWLEEEYPECNPEWFNSASVVQVNRSLYFIGGYDNAVGLVTPDVRILNLDNLTWSSGPRLPIPVMYSSLIFFKNTIYTFGGKVVNRLDFGCIGVALKLSLDAAFPAWAPLAVHGDFTPYQPLPAVLFDGIRKRIYNLSWTERRLFCLDELGKWEEKAEYPNGYHSPDLYGSTETRLYVFQIGVSNDFSFYDAMTNQWTLCKCDGVVVPIYIPNGLASRLILYKGNFYAFWELRVNGPQDVAYQVVKFNVHKSRWDLVPNSYVGELNYVTYPHILVLG